MIRVIIRAHDQNLIVNCEVNKHSKNNDFLKSLFFY